MNENLFRTVVVGLLVLLLGVATAGVATHRADLAAQLAESERQGAVLAEWNRRAAEPPRWEF